MNFFEYNDFDILKEEFDKNMNGLTNMLADFDELSNSNNFKNTDIIPTCENATFRKYFRENKEWILICYTHLDVIFKNVITIYTRSNTDVHDVTWSKLSEISLTDLLIAEGLQVKSVVYYDLLHNTNILVVFHSSEQLHVIRIDINTITSKDILSFNSSSIFVPSISENPIIPDFIITPDYVRFLILIDKTASSNVPYFPTVSELQLVLTKRLLSGILSLFSFWTAELLSVNESTDVYHRGLPLPHYKTLLYIHQAVLLNVITNHCRVETALSSTSNKFLEHLTNIANDYLNNAISIIFSWPNNDISVENGCNIISKMLDMLGDNSRIYRDLVLTSRSTLSVYQRLSINRSVKKSLNVEKICFPLDRFKAMDKNDVISECLKTRNLAALQNYSLKHCGKLTTDQELIQQSKILVLSMVDTCEWKDLQEFVSNLGYEPIKALTSLCNESKIRRIRDYLYRQLDLDRCSADYRLSKNLLDQMEVAYTISISDVTNSSFHSLIFSDGLKSKENRLEPMKGELFKPKHGSSSQLIDLNLNLFLGLLTRCSDNDKQVIIDSVELCLIDADYRKMLFGTVSNGQISQEKLVIWIYKWRKNIPLFVKYVTQSCYVDLITTVFDIDISNDCVIGGKLIGQLTLMMLDHDGNQYTYVDQQIAKEALLYILTQYPDSLIARLEHLYADDLTKAEDILLMISETFPVHLMCQSPSCHLRKSTMKDFQVLRGINKRFIERIIANSWDSEFPIVFFYLLKDSRSMLDLNSVSSRPSLRKAALLHNAITSKTAVDTFKCLISRDVTTLTDEKLTSSELDEIAFAALLSGISYNNIMESSNPTVSCIRKTLVDHKYWDLLKKRLLQPPGYDARSSNVEQYYEANVYNFLYRSGTPLPLDTVFSNQPRNPFSKKVTDGDTPAANVTTEKTHSLMMEQQKESLNYIYYLSLGRPYQAFCSIEKEFGISGKPGCVPKSIMRDLVISIYKIALSNVSDRPIIGGCFALLRLIGSSTELLRCYLTLVQWVIDWHVDVNDCCEIYESNESKISTSDIRRHYSAKTMSLFKFCLSKNTSERKNSRDLLIRQFEEIFIWRLKNSYYTCITDVLSAWSIVLYFCQMHGSQSSTAILQYYASQDEWLLFLCISQIFGYSKDQVKEALNKFENASIRHHMCYIVSKVEDLTNQRQTPVKKEDILTNSKKAKLQLSKSARSVSASSVLDNTNQTVNAKSIAPTESLQTNDFLSYRCKNNKKYLLSTLKNSAKKSLFELIFDCQLENIVEAEPTEDQSKVSVIRLDTRKLLGYCLALGHPFISVLAFSADVYKNNTPDFSKSNKFVNYLSCLACFIVSSSPKKTQESIWNKWSCVAKLDWSEEDLIDLIKFTIENKCVNVVSHAFAVLKIDQFPCISSFFSMVAHAIETFNPVLRQLYLEDFVNGCVSICGADSTFISTKDRHRNKSSKNSALLFVNRLLTTSLLVALQSVEKSLGVRILYEWLKSLSNSTSGLLHSSVKKLFTFVDTNVSLLANVLSLYFDFVDLDPNSQMKQRFKNPNIPVNTKSKEFMLFVEGLIDRIIEKLNSCYDYTRLQLASMTLALVEEINQIHTIQLPSNRDKWKSNEAQLRSMSVRKMCSKLISTDDLSDLVSMALAGQVDRMESVCLCKNNEKHSSTSTEMENSQNRFSGNGPDSWRQLVIPEEWQDRMLNLPILSIEDNTEKVSHVSFLLNEKRWTDACNYMIEKEFTVKDAILILTSMKVACGKLDPTKLPTSIRDYCKSNTDTYVKEPTTKLPVRRMSVILSTSASKPNLMHSSDSDSNFTRSMRQSRSVDTCQQFLTRIIDSISHGEEMVEYICTIHCVANKMSESYISVASREEFDVLTKILVGTCRDKIDTADMYLGVVDMDPDNLCQFIADIIVQVLRLEIQTYLGSTSAMDIAVFPTSLSPKRSKGNNKIPHFSLSPTGTGSPKSVLSSSPSAISIRTAYSASSHAPVPSLHESTLKVAERCQLRSEWKTGVTIKTQSESRLIKAFTLSDLLVLSPSARKLGKILFSYYQRFSQEVFSSNEDAEFLVHLLIQCHNCFTEGGDTIGISNCLKAAKELTKILNANGHYVLMAQLLCRIGRYGEMHYIFSHLIENHQFEQLLRKDMDKDGVIVPYIFDYLNRNHSDDYEKIEIVCVKYKCYYELAETKSKMANLSVAKLKNHIGMNSVKETLKSLTSSIINNLLEACKNYLKAGCYKKMEESFRKAQFYKLQQKWLEDPDKTFTVGTLSKTGRASAGRVILPETGQPYGVNLLNLNSEQAMAFLKKIPNFYTAFIICDQLRLSSEVWTDLLVHHVLHNGDETYLRHYLAYFGTVLSSNFVQQCINKCERLSSTKLSNKLGLLNLKSMLAHCDDVFFVKRISENYKLDS